MRFIYQGNGRPGLSLSVTSGEVTCVSQNGRFLKTGMEMVVLQCQRTCVRLRCLEEGLLIQFGSAAVKNGRQICALVSLSVSPPVPCPPFFCVAVLEVGLAGPRSAWSDAHTGVHFGPHSNSSSRTECSGPGRSGAGGGSPSGTFSVFN